MAHADRDTLVVEHLADVVGVDALDVEGDGTDPVDGVRRADHADPRALRQTGQEPLGEGVLVRGDPVQARTVPQWWCHPMTTPRTRLTGVAFGSGVEFASPRVTMYGCRIGFPEPSSTGTMRPLAVSSRRAGSWRSSTIRCVAGSVAARKRARCSASSQGPKVRTT